MDCSVIPLKKYKDYSLVQSVDFFYPVIDDPYILGKIALANVVSDVYAVGATEIDKLNMIISSPTEMSDKERDVVLPMIMKGFRDAANGAGCHVQIQNICFNPWIMLGGIATSVNLKKDILMPCNAKNGDVLVLTKPLGTHLATSAFLWMQDKTEKYETLKSTHSDDDIMQAYQIAVKSMAYLNRNAAALMMKHGAHAATDVTGFGIYGHAENLSEFQKEPLLFKITSLPIIKNILNFATLLNMHNKLLAGKAVETSGGLLIAFPPENAEAFCDEFESVTNGEFKAWIVGEVTTADKSGALLADQPKHIEVDLPIN